jgi:hypothetical protein
MQDIVGDREKSSYVKEEKMLTFLEEQLPMYANEDVGEYFEKNFKGIGFLKSTDMNPSLKIKEILTNYCYVSKKRADLKIERDNYKDNSEALLNACTNFKKLLKSLDEKFSE